MVIYGLQVYRDFGTGDLLGDHLPAIAAHLAEKEQAVIGMAA